MERFKCDTCKGRIEETVFGFLDTYCANGYWHGLGEDLSKGEDVYYPLWDSCEQYENAFPDDGEV